MNSLISNATSLTKSLSKLEQVSSGSNKKGLLALGTNDIDMECGEGSDSNNNTNKVGGGEHSRFGVKDSLQVENCDFKDVILCNLIDDFLLKENEFWGSFLFGEIDYFIISFKYLTLFKFLFNFCLTVYTYIYI